MINENPRFFDKNEHLFIIANKNVYDDVKKYKNVKFDSSILDNHITIKKYAEQTSYIFLHENQTIKLKTMLRLRRQVLNKIIWCVWGHDLYEVYSNRGILRTIKSKLKNRLRIHIANKFHAIGVGFRYDSKIAQTKYKKPKIVYTPYGYVKNQKAEIDNVIKNAKSHRYTRVMVGHSAYPFLNHKKILEKLSRYKNEDIRISLVLAYGDSTYAEEVKNYAYKIFDEEKIEIVTKTTSHQDYIKYLQSVDVCILDFPHQAALGNFYILCYMNKTFFLDKKGILRQAADSERIKTYLIEDLDTISFSQFKQKLIDNHAERNFGLYYIDDKNYLRIWKGTLDSLK